MTSHGPFMIRAAQTGERVELIVALDGEVFFHECVISWVDSEHVEIEPRFNPCGALSCASLVTFPSGSRPYVVGCRETKAKQPIDPLVVPKLWSRRLSLDEVNAAKLADDPDSATFMDADDPDVRVLNADGMPPLTCYSDAWPHEADDCERRIRDAVAWGFELARRRLTDG